MFAGLCPRPVLLNGLYADEEFGTRVHSFSGIIQGWKMRVQGEPGPAYERLEVLSKKDCRTRWDIMFLI